MNAFVHTTRTYETTVARNNNGVGGERCRLSACDRVYHGPPNLATGITNSGTVYEQIKQIYSIIWHVYVSFLDSLFKFRYCLLSLSQGKRTMV